MGKCGCVCESRIRGGIWFGLVRRLGQWSRCLKGSKW
jgi:hypothetical protein